MKNFIITVDTEGDNLWKWKDGESITTYNSRFIPRFQELCESYGFKPVYLTNYEMALEDAWVSYIKTKVQQGLCEIGMHIHAWNSPPEYKLINNNGGNPYITEYPDDLIYEKMKFLTECLQERFEVPIKVARSGRWATNETYFDTLCNLGYIGDCSFTPELDLSKIPGYSYNAGNDYRKVNKNTHLHPSGIVEVPMTTRLIHHISIGSLGHKARTLIKGDSMWLRPHRKSLDELLILSNRIKEEGGEYLEFMLHSSELMPGGSPYFKSENEVEILYNIMQKYFSWVEKEKYKGLTLSKYIENWKVRNVNFHNKVQLK